MSLTRVVLAPLVALLALTITQSSHADTYIRQVTTTPPMKTFGQEIPARNDTTEIWMSAERAYTRGADGNGVLFDPKTEMLYLIDHKAKLVTEISLADGINASPVLETMRAKAKAEGKTLTPEQEKAMEEMAGKMSGMASAMAASMKVTVVPKDETKKIRTWNTRRHDISIEMAGMKTEGEIWASPDVPVDMAAYTKLTYAKLATTAGFKDIMKEAEKVKGFPILTTGRTNAMGVEVEVVTEVIDIDTRPAPAGTYDIPSGYERKGKLK